MVFRGLKTNQILMSALFFYSKFELCKNEKYTFELIIFNFPQTFLYISLLSKWYVLYLQIQI